MTRIPATPNALDEPAISVRPAALDVVRREFRRTRGSERWSSRRLSEQLPRVALHEALEILLDWRGEHRFDAGAVAWHARLAGHAPGLTLEGARRALIALEEFGGASPDVGALSLRALCERYRLAEAARVVDDWLAQRKSYGGF
jgi:hypothetical protein